MLSKAMKGVARRIARWTFRYAETYDNWRSEERLAEVRGSFAEIGLEVNIGPNCVFLSPETISFGSYVFIASGAHFSAVNTKIQIGNKVMFGPEVAIIAGDHNTSVLGAYMYDIKEKLPGNDEPVIIEDDVWIGARATILKGVTIGRGSIVAACAVVTRNVPRYSIVAGCPAKVIKKRWTEEEIRIHEQKVYGSHRE